MKKLILIIGLLTTMPAFALSKKTLTEVCDRISSASTTVDCLRAGRNAYLDGYALGACNRIKSASTTVDCVRAIADKEYSLAEVKVCDRISDASTTVDCLRNTGTYRRRRDFPGDGVCLNPDRLLQRMEEALDANYDGRHREANRILERIIERIERRSYNP